MQQQRGQVALDQYHNNTFTTLNEKQVTMTLWLLSFRRCPKFDQTCITVNLVLF